MSEANGNRERGRPGHGTAEIGIDSWSAHQGVPLLRTLAQALCVLERQSGLDRFTLPYPAAAQHALDRTAVACLLAGERPPASLGELVARCQDIPLEDWPLRLAEGTVGPDDLLLDPRSGRPTELCHEWAESGADPALRHRDRQIVHTALTLCRQHGEEDAYSSFRGLLVRRPVLTAAEMFEVLGDMLLEPVHELIRIVYQPAPQAYRRSGHYAQCGRCLTLLNPLGDTEWWCERDRCRRAGSPPVGRIISDEEAGTVLQLERSLRQFVTGPGRAEADLEHALRAMGLEVRMWPGFDAYDLLVTFPDGLRWAVDVKDWASPYFLGKAAAPVPRTPPYDEAFWVVPQHRVDARPDYLKVFALACGDAQSAPELLTDSELIRRAALGARTSHARETPKENGRA
ncbi:pPIWI_RE_Y domain-containing protein [Streptomyces sp. NPDC004779]